MIALDKDAALWTVTLQRADKANALTGQMLADLDAIMAQAAQEQPRALILTGDGKVFSAGADLDEARMGLATDPVWDRLSNRIAALPCLTIAALNGTLAGGAMGMALACDLRLAVASAKFFYPVMRLGYAPQPADPARLVALIGAARAKMILLAGARIDATRAYDWGLIDEIVEPLNLLAHARSLTADALQALPGHGAHIKSMIHS
jgi:enoyl-CoA hydratase/carnithine racemase